MGSGTTAVACQQLDVRLYGIEIGEHFCALAVEVGDSLDCLTFAWRKKSDAP